MNQWACYPKSDPDYATFLAHPEWWLRDDNGNAVLAAVSGSPQYDFTNPAGVQHWLAMPIAGLDGVIDGFLFDGGAIYNQPANVSASRAAALEQGMWSAIGSMQQRLTAANGGLALANGMIGGPINPHTPDDPYNLGVLAHADGIENERGTPTFELVNHTSGAFLNDGVAANLAAIERASQLANGTKVRTCSTVFYSICGPLLFLHSVWTAAAGLVNTVHARHLIPALPRRNSTTQHNKHNTTQHKQGRCGQLLGRAVRGVPAALARRQLERAPGLRQGRHDQPHAERDARRGGAGLEGHAGEVAALQPRDVPERGRKGHLLHADGVVRVVRGLPAVSEQPRLVPGARPLLPADAAPARRPGRPAGAARPVKII